MSIILAEPRLRTTLRDIIRESRKFTRLVVPIRSILEFCTFNKCKRLIKVKALANEASRTFGMRGSENSGSLGLRTFVLRFAFVDTQ